MNLQSRYNITQASGMLCFRWSDMSTLGLAKTLDEGVTVAKKKAAKKKVAKKAPAKKKVAKKKVAKKKGKCSCK